MHDSHYENKKSSVKEQSAQNVISVDREETEPYCDKCGNTTELTQSGPCPCSFISEFVATEENNESQQSQHIEVQDQAMIKEEPVNLEDSISIKEEPLV